jgi:aryl-alcohol dehydrogenase-like predicted oxidoreductase
METRTLLHTDLAVPRACLGAMTFGAQADEAVAARLADMCLERGLNFFDTANIYNQGASEAMLGRLLKGRRGRVVLATKVRMKMEAAPEESGLSRAAILKAVESSLRRLQTDWVDICYLHAPDDAVPVEQSLEAMDALVRAGKVRAIGLSNYAGWQVVETLWISERRGWRPPAVTQVMYNLLARGVEQEYVPMCRRFGVALLAYNPLAAGLLTGKQQAAAPLAGTRFDNNPLYLDRYWHPVFFEAVERLRRAAAAAGRSLIDVSLNWLLHHTAADGVVLGASKPEQLAENLDALERGPLPAEVVEVCEAAWKDLRGVTPKYNR